MDSSPRLILSNLIAHIEVVFDLLHGDFVLTDTRTLLGKVHDLFLLCAESRNTRPGFPERILYLAVDVIDTLVEHVLRWAFRLLQHILLLGGLLFFEDRLVYP